MKQLIILFGFLLVSSTITQAQADCKATPPDGLSPIAAYSIFHSNYRNGDYEFALKYGRWMACAKPEKLEGNPRFSLSRHYERLITIYEEVARTKEDPAVRSAYLDTALTLFDESIELFGDDEAKKFDIIFERGRFYQQNYDHITDGLNKAYQSYEEMFMLDPEKAIGLGDGYYMRTLLDDLVRKGEKERAQKIIDLLMPIATGDNLAYLNEQQEELLGSPEEQLEYYNGILADNPDDIEALKAVAEAHSQLGNRAELAEARKKIHELDPSFDSAYELAKIESGNANYSEAAKYYEEALAMAQTDEEKIELNMALAQNAFNRGNLQTARGYVRTVLNLDANHGAAYIELAEIYAEAITQCTSDRKLQAQDRAVYWLVVDYLNKAKQVDSSVSSRANNLLSAYEPVTPTTEDRFLTLNLDEGDQVKIDGSLMPCYSWIGETTTAR